MVHLSQLLGQPETFHKRKEYKMGDLLGEGSFGIVRAAYWKKHNPPINVAVKVLSKHELQGDLDLVEQELEVLKKCDHLNIVKLYDHFESKDKFYIVMEQATGGLMIDRMIHQHVLSEAHVVNVLRGITSAVDYLHSRNIAHRDIKPENILYLTKAEDSPVVLVDFGVAALGQLMSSLAGSFLYAAPEVLGDMEYGAEVDMWSIGILAYVLITGYVPFKGNNPKEVHQDQLAHAAGFDDKYWSKVNPAAQDFVRSCLTIDWNNRLTASEGLKHPWLVAEPNDTINIVAGLQENYGRDHPQRPPMPRRATHLSHIDRQGRTRHELESSDESSDEEDDQPSAQGPQGSTNATVGATETGAATGAGGGAAAAAPATTTAPNAAQPSSAVTPATPASVAASSARPSTSVSRAPTPAAQDGPASNRPSTSGTRPNVDGAAPTSETGSSNQGSNKGLISGLASLVVGDKKDSSGSDHPRSTSGGSEMGRSRSKNRFSFLRLSRSSSRAGSRSGSPRPDVKSSAQLDENAFDDTEGGEVPPIRR